MGVGLVKAYKALMKLVSEALSSPFWCLCQKISLSFFTVIKLLPHKSSEWSNLVPDPKAKSFSLEVTNPTLFTTGYQKKMVLLKWCNQYTSKFGKLSSGHKTGKGQFSFQSKECSNYCIIMFISHASRVLIKILQLGFSSTWTENFQMEKLG